MSAAELYHIDIGDGPDDVGVCEERAWASLCAAAHGIFPASPRGRDRWLSRFLHAPGDLGLAQDVVDEIYERARGMWRAERRAAVGCHYD